MRTFAWTFSVFLLTILFMHCSENQETPTLPSGCSSQGNYAISVLDKNITCVPTNAFQDANEALGAPDAGVTGPGKLQFHGFVSLGINGSVTLYMGSCIQDLDGADIRVYQSVSTEALEVQVSQNPTGPFVSLGVKPCIDQPAFKGFCDFDLAGSGLNQVRVVKIVDRESVFFVNAQCDNVGPSPGADLDAVEVLHPVQ